MIKEFYFTCNSLVLNPSTINLFTDFPERLYNKSTREFRFSKYGRFFVFKCSELCARYVYSYITQVAEAKDYGTLNTIHKANDRGIEVAYLSNENMGSKKEVKPTKEVKSSIKKNEATIPGLEVTSRGLRILYALPDKRQVKKKIKPKGLTNGLFSYKSSRLLDDGSKLSIYIPQITENSFHRLSLFLNGLNSEQLIDFMDLYSKSNRYIYFARGFKLVGKEEDKSIGVKPTKRKEKAKNVLVKEVPVEVIKEVPVEVVKEVVKEVPVEVVKEVQVQQEVETGVSSEIELLELELELATKEKELAEKRLKLAQLKRGL